MKPRGQWSSTSGAEDDMLEQLEQRIKSRSLDLPGETMYSCIDKTKSHDIANEIIPILEDAGYSVEEIIPGLIQAVVDLAKGSEPLLDDAANFLADGGD